MVRRKMMFRTVPRGEKPADPQTAEEAVEMAVEQPTMEAVPEDKPQPIVEESREEKPEAAADEASAKKPNNAATDKQAAADERNKIAIERIRTLKQIVDGPKYVGAPDELVPFAWRNPMTLDKSRKVSKVLRVINEREMLRAALVPVDLNK